MRALLFFFFLAVSACAAQKLQTLPAFKPAEVAGTASESTHQPDHQSSTGSESSHEPDHQPSTGSEPEQPHFTTFPSFPWGAWGPFLPTDRHQRPNQGFFPGGINQGIYPGLNPGFIPGIYPGFNPGPFPGFGPQFPYPAFGR